jgi:hypothetical protein
VTFCIVACYKSGAKPKLRCKQKNHYNYPKIDPANNCYSRLAWKLLCTDNHFANLATCIILSETDKISPVSPSQTLLVSPSSYNPKPHSLLEKFLNVAPRNENGGSVDERQKMEARDGIRYQIEWERARWNERVTRGTMRGSRVENCADCGSYHEPRIANQEFTSWHDGTAKRKIHGCHLHRERPSSNPREKIPNSKKSQKHIWFHSLNLKDTQRRLFWKFNN